VALSSPSAFTQRRRQPAETSKSLKGFPMTTIDDHLNNWLRDAHAAEEQAETMLSTASDRLKDYPDLAIRIRQHQDETTNQRKLLEECLERRGTSTSTTKDLMAKTSAMFQDMGKAMAGDEVVKTVLFSYAFEQMEIASYRILVTAAEAAGDQQTRSVCERILQEEIAMADWLQQHSDAITRQFLAREDDTTARTARA
jgi:ferritin-like metal-binding protein YciE